MEFSTLNWAEDSMFDDEFHDMFIAKYESLLMDDEPEYNVFEFDDLCSAANFLMASTSKFDSLSASIKLKTLANSLKYSFLGLDESLSYCFRLPYLQNKEAVSWTLGDNKVLVP